MNEIQIKNAPNKLGAFAIYLFNYLLQVRLVREIFSSFCVSKFFNGHLAGNVSVNETTRKGLDSTIEFLNTAVVNSY
jgi:hypothetical protein